MIRRLLILAIFGVAASGASPRPADLNGRWIIEVKNEARGRVWWLKITGAGTPAMAGEFVGAPGGQLDRIRQLRLSPEGDLNWEFEGAFDRERKQPQRGLYRARLNAAGMLEGRLDVDGQLRYAWLGKRAPEIRDTDDGKWIKQKPVELFDGRDLAGWAVTAAGRSIAEWVVENGILRNGKGRAPDIASAGRFWNFDLRVEFRVAQHSNSGIGLRGRYEVQVFGDHGEPPTLHGNGALYSRIAPVVNATAPPDAWQVFEIRFIGREITVRLNGRTLMEKRDVEGYTAMATDPHEDQPGPITLQGDHGPVEFRRVSVTPLVRAK